MTGSASEQSLLRARSAHSSHSHSHKRPRHQHPSHGDRDHNREHHEAPPADDAGSHGINAQPQRREPQAVEGAPPQLNADNFVTQVIQTVSLIQYVDPAGSAYETQTFYAPPNTVVIDTVSGNTVNIPPPDSSLTAVDSEPTAPPPAPPAAPLPSDPVTSAPVPPAPQPPSSSLSEPSEPALPPPSESLVSSDPAPLPVSESVTSSPAVTSAPLPPASTYPTLIGSRNSTNTALSSTLSSISIPLNNSTLSAQAASSSTSSFTTPSARQTTSSQARRKSKSQTSSLTESVFSSITSDFPTSTGTATDSIGGIGGGVGGTGGLPGGAEPTSADPEDSDSPSSSGGLSAQNKQVIGGVVGGVAGIAVFAMLLFLLLRYKRKQNGQPLFGSGQAPGSRGMVTEGDGQGPSGPSMTERTGPFGVSAALASLNRKAPPQQQVATEERGFYRVSGKKLPSVLHAGGDGYTDPRESVVSGHSDYYRGSQEFDPNTAGGGRLALGSPMRPVSGVPVMRTGPARTPVAVSEANPFDDPPPPPDPVGRSLVGQDGSRGSGSRFHERI